MKKGDVIKAKNTHSVIDGRLGEVIEVRGEAVVAKFGIIDPKNTVVATVELHPGFFEKDEEATELLKKGKGGVIIR